MSRWLALTALIVLLCPCSLSTGMDFRQYDLDHGKSEDLSRETNEQILFMDCPALQRAFGPIEHLKLHSDRGTVLGVGPGWQGHLRIDGRGEISYGLHVNRDAALNVSIAYFFSGADYPECSSEIRLVPFEKQTAVLCVAQGRPNELSPNEFQFPTIFCIRTDQLGLRVRCLSRRRPSSSEIDAVFDGLLERIKLCQNRILGAKRLQ
jgi:hypothetical protein